MCYNKRAQNPYIVAGGFLSAVVGLNGSRASAALVLVTPERFFCELKQCQNVGTEISGVLHFFILLQDTIGNELIKNVV